MAHVTNGVRYVFYMSGWKTQSGKLGWREAREVVEPVDTVRSSLHMALTGFWSDDATTAMFMEVRKGTC